MKRRDLTPEEQALWDLVTKGDVRLRNRKSATSPSPLVGEGGVGGIFPRVRSKPLRVPPLPNPPPQGGRESLLQGDYAGIDRNTATRFRKGKFPLDATLDLHGMNREKAYKTLAGFIKNHYEQGSRCVLVITGKGQKLMEETEPNSRGVLRECLPQWLDEPSLKPVILAFDNARQQHGGSGAFYILLRRKR